MAELFLQPEAGQRSGLVRRTKRDKDRRNQPIVRRETLEEMRRATRVAFWTIQQFFRVRRQRLQNLLRPASWKINDERLDACRRGNVDFIGLPVIQDKITRFIDREPGTVCAINRASVEHALHRKQRARRKGVVAKSSRHKKRGLLQGRRRWHDVLNLSALTFLRQAAFSSLP